MTTVNKDIRDSLERLEQLVRLAGDNVCASFYSKYSILTFFVGYWGSSPENNTISKSNCLLETNLFKAFPES